MLLGSSARTPYTCNEHQVSSTADVVTAALFVGDLTLDLTMQIDHVPAPDEKVHVTAASETAGGVIANASVACARSGKTARAFVQIGTDTAATQATAGLRDQGVVVETVVAEGRTARVVILIEPHGEKRLLLDPGVSLYPSEAAVTHLDLSGVGWVHTAVYGPAAFLLVERCRRDSIPWSLDLEPATFPDGLDTLAILLPGAVVFCNDRATAAIGLGAEARLIERGVAAVIRTRGSMGAQLITQSGTTTVAAPDLGRVVDTTGAGDCLAGWFIGAHLAGQTMEAALRAAVTAATLSCQGPGAQASYPTVADVERLLVLAPSFPNDEAS